MFQEKSEGSEVSEGTSGLQEEPGGTGKFQEESEYSMRSQRIPGGATVLPFQKEPESSRGS